MLAVVVDITTVGIFLSVWFWRGGSETLLVRRRADAADRTLTKKRVTASFGLADGVQRDFVSALKVNEVVDGGREIQRARNRNIRPNFS